MKPTSIAPRRLIADSNGLSQNMQQASKNVSWDLVDAIEETPSHIFIAIEGTYSIVIPKNEVDLGEVQDFLNCILGYQVNSNSLS